MTSADVAKVKEALMMGVRWGILRNLPHFEQVHTEALGALQRIIKSNGNRNSAQVAAAMAAAEKPVPFLIVPDGEPVPGECPTGL